jgi:hypothetical protein
MTDVPTDLFGFEAPSEEQLVSISTWAKKALELQAEINILEAHLKALNKDLALIEEIELPQALLTANISEFKLINGEKITIKDVIQGGLSKDPTIREFTMQWVVEEGGEEIIKDHFELDFTRGGYEQAVALRKLLSEHKFHFDEFESIHGMTLQAFMREKMKENVMPPFDKMGIRFFKKAIIKTPNKGE